MLLRKVFNHLIKNSSLLLPPIFLFSTLNSINSNKDYYKILNVNSKASASDVKKSFYQLAKKYHPDVNKGKEDLFKEINEAYEVLGDESKRKQYDDLRTFSSSQSTSNPGGYSYGSYGAQNPYANQNYSSNNGYQNPNQQQQQNYYYYHEERSGTAKNPKHFRNVKFTKMNQEEMRFNTNANPNMSFQEEVLKEFMKNVYGKVNNDQNFGGNRQNTNTNNPGSSNNYNNHGYSNINRTHSQSQNNNNYYENNGNNNKNNNNYSYYDNYYDNDKMQQGKNQEEFHRQQAYEKMQREKEVKKKIMLLFDIYHLFDIK